MPTEQELILTRIRQALRVPAPAPHADTPVSSHDPRAWLPFVGPTESDRFALFAKNAADLRADFHLADSPDQWIAHLRQTAISDNWQRIASHHASLTDQAAAALNLPTLWTDNNYDPHELETYDAGITECDALIAQTGSVLVTTRSAGGRGLSVLPPHHIVLARRDQLLPDLPAAFALLKSKYAPDFPSFISLITGPSRTGDIERILVLGAHGPRKLTIICF